MDRRELFTSTSGALLAAATAQEFRDTLDKSELPDETLEQIVVRRVKEELCRVVDHWVNDKGFRFTLDLQDAPDGRTMLILSLVGARTPESGTYGRDFVVGETDLQKVIPEEKRNHYSRARVKT